MTVVVETETPGVVVLETADEVVGVVVDEEAGVVEEETGVVVEVTTVVDETVELVEVVEEGEEPLYIGTSIPRHSCIPTSLNPFPRRIEMMLGLSLGLKASTVHE